MVKYFVSRGRQLTSRISAWLKTPVAYKFRSASIKKVELIRRIEDAMFDKRHGLDCSGFLENHELETDFAEASSHAQAYEAINCAAIRELMREVEKTAIAFDNFIDLGSGKGRACFFAATEYDFKKIIGVEFSLPLVEAARVNMQNFRKGSGSSNIDFVHGNAAEFSIPAGNNLIFLFNPFDKVILMQFLEKNMAQFKQSQSMIAYSNDKHRLCLTAGGFATLFRNQDTQSSLYQYLSS